MHVAAQHDLDIAEPLDDGLEAARIDAAEFIQVRNPRDKRREMHHDDRWFIRVPFEDAGQPSQPRAIHVAMVLVRDARVQTDDSHRVVVDTVMQGPCAGYS